MPIRCGKGNVGWDVHLHEIKNTTGQVEFYRTGIAIEPPPGYYFLMFPRSSLSKTDYIMANGVAVLDPCFTGEVLVALRKCCPDARPLELPGRYVQLVPQQFFSDNLEAVPADELSSTERGAGGFGSTGV